MSYSRSKTNLRLASFPSRFPTKNDFLAQKTFLGCLIVWTEEPSKRLPDWGGVFERFLIRMVKKKKQKNKNPKNKTERQNNRKNLWEHEKQLLLPGYYSPKLLACGEKAHETGHFKEYLRAPIFSLHPRTWNRFKDQIQTLFQHQPHLWICWSNFLLCSVHLVFSPPSPSISAVALAIFLLHASASSTSVCLSRMAWSYLACTASNSRCFSSNCSCAALSSVWAFSKRASWMIRLAFTFERNRTQRQRDAN